MSHEEYMEIALLLAEKAGEEGEVPVGCVIVSGDGQIIGRGSNGCEKEHSALAHAEMKAIAEASRALGDWRLEDCTMYVTLEPCPMCAGAIINSRLPKLFYAAKEERYGSCGSVINLFEENYGHRVQIRAGIKGQESARLLSAFFEKAREKKG